MVYSDNNNRDATDVALKDEDVRVDISSYGPVSATGATNISIDISIDLYTYNRDEEYYVKIFRCCRWIDRLSIDEWVDG